MVRFICTALTTACGAVICSFCDGLVYLFLTAEYEDEDYFRTQVTALKEVHSLLLQLARASLPLSWNTIAWTV